MNSIRYFDHAATTQVKEEVLKAMIPFLSIEYGNPSSIYGIGRRAKKAIEESREKVARIINAKPKEIYFTGCGSESDNLAIKGIAYEAINKGKHIITTKIEHHAVLNTCETLENEGFRVTYLNVDKNGLVILEDLINAITPETTLISIMTANNEIGTIQPIAEIGRIANENNIYFHTDSVQAIGNLKIDVQDMNIDSLSMSAHKFYGPKGIGALYVRENVPFRKIQDGGHQEKDKRAGTENVAGIVGLGKAIEMSYNNLEEHTKKIEEIRNYYIAKVKEKIPEIKINGDMKKRLPGNANISFKDVDGGEVLLKLDEQGICVSTGSACNSAASTPSHVLTAIGLEAEFLDGSLRTTFGYENTKEDIDFLIFHLERIIKECRQKK